MLYPIVKQSQNRNDYRIILIIPRIFFHSHFATKSRVSDYADFIMKFTIVNSHYKYIETDCNKTVSLYVKFMDALIG